jgi:hypothetical protein
MKTMRFSLFGFSLTTMILFSALNEATGKVASKGAKTDELKEVEWKALIQINSSNPKVIPELKTTIGKRIKVGGFIFANEFEQGNLKEFLLTPIGQSCTHVPPPPPNYLIHVKVQDGVAVKYTDRPVLVTGKLNLTKSKENRTMHSYEMEAEKVIDYPMEKK